ncbi:MAG: NAD-dependent DNA ligase LigA, partial [Bacteroidales bacterium]|nr:NAD-dependent DNA ligase LigA [Bacteroidales bacterium]
KYDIPSDGLVLTYDDISYSESLGTTAKYPKHSLAFKWQDETVETQLESVDWSVSRTGLINPIAIFKPVEIDGSVVRRASLHNVSIVKRLKLGVGDTIKVYKANMIIPQISENITMSDTLNIPSTCPTCHQKAVILTENDIDYLYCTNKLCSAKFLKRLALFTSKNAMNIDGLSDAILSKLVSEGLIKEFCDLYKLEDYCEKIIKFDGFGKKSYENLINSINKSRSVKLYNFIYALGIPGIGLSRAKLICNYANNNYETVKKLTFEELSDIPGIGEVIAKAWFAAFQNEELRTEVDKVAREISFSDIDKSVSTTLTNKTFVITGGVYQFNNREELIEFIERSGGKVVSAISSKVNYLINNDIDSGSTKNKQAKQLGIEIISEEQLVQLIRSNKEKKGVSKNEANTK